HHEEHQQLQHQVQQRREVRFRLVGGGVAHTPSGRAISDKQEEPSDGATEVYPPTAFLLLADGSSLIARSYFGFTAAAPGRGRTSGIASTVGTTVAAAGGAFLEL